MRKFFSLSIYALGLLLALAAASLLAVFSALYGEAGHIVGFSVFGAVLLAFYFVKVLRMKSGSLKLKKWDQAFIYLLMAATYTPVALLLPERAWGWSIFGVVWGIGLIAFSLRMGNVLPEKYIAAGAYLSLIALDITAFSVVHDFLNAGAIFWLSLGGSSYLTSTFLVMFRPKALNQVDLLALIIMLFGSFCHFWAMIRWVL